MDSSSNRLAGPYEEYLMNASEIKKMNVTERLQAMETLWSSLVYENVELESPDWHGEILSERKAKIEKGTARFISLEKLRE